VPHIWLWEPNIVAVWSKDFAGLCTAKTNGGSDHLQDTYYLQGSLASPAGAMKAIADAQSKITDLQKQGYDVTTAKNLLDQAQTAYASGDYATAQSLAGKASDAAVAPFPWMLVTAIVALLVIAGAVGGFMLRKRRREEQED